MIYKKIKVEWEDITFYNGHKNITELDNLIIEKYSTIGYQIKKDKNFLIIALTLREDKQGFTDVYKFPIGCIKKIVYLKEMKVGTGIFTYKENCQDCKKLSLVDINGFCKDCYTEEEGGLKE